MNRSMTRALLAAVATIGLVAADLRQNDPGAEDLKRMQGDWMVASMTTAGVKVPDEEAQALFRTVTADRYVVSRYAKVIGQGSFKLDAAKRPKTIDSTPTQSPNQADKILGIYEFDGRYLRICNAPPGKPRPTDFEARPGIAQTMTVWEPEKS